MELEPDHGPFGESESTAARSSSRQCHLEAIPQEFPRRTVCIDGCVVKVSICRSSESYSSKMNSIQYICLSSSTETISKFLFKYCANLAYFTFECASQVSSLGKSAFEFCSSLQSICIPSSVEMIAKSCFNYCEKLSALTFEPGCQISILGESAFSSCSSLHSICIPSSVQMIATSCFNYCRNLSELTFESGSDLGTLGDYAFADCSSLQSIPIPASLREVTGLAMADSGIDTVAVDKGSGFLRVCGLYLVDLAETCLIQIGRAHV
jgi:hypothetical protein